MDQSMTTVTTVSKSHEHPHPDHPRHGWVAKILLPSHLPHVLRECVRRHRNVSRVRVYATTPSLPFQAGTCGRGRFAKTPIGTRPCTSVTTYPLRRRTTPRTNVPMRRPRETASQYQVVVSSILHPGVPPWTPNVTFVYTSSTRRPSLVVWIPTSITCPG